MKTFSFIMKDGVKMDNLKDRVTIYEVAKAANVSLATVSRVINKRGNVKEKTRKQVEDTIKRLGYMPSGVAKALATNKSTNIGVVLPSANYVYIANMLNGMVEVSKERGYNLTLFVTSHSHDDALKIVDNVITSHVDGAIVFDDELSEEDAKTISSYAVPVVAINNYVSGENSASIIFKYEDKLREVFLNKINSPYQKPFFFLHVPNSGRLLGQAEGVFVQTLNEKNVPYNIINIDDSYRKTYATFNTFFKTNRKGYFVAYRDSLAAAIINAAIDNNLNVPEDIEVLSLIGTKYSNIIRPTISNMFLDMSEVGRRAVYIMNDLSEGKLLNPIFYSECIYNKNDSTKE